jgi:hypothetical protein
MTSEQFDRWFQRYSASFPGVHTWLGKFRGNGGSVGIKDILDQWRSALERTDLDEAVEAVGLMFKGDEEPPRAYEDVPRVVRAICRRRRASRPTAKGIDGQQTVRCQLCQDIGMVRVWQASSLHYLRACHKDGEQPEPSKMHAGSVACTCDAGECCTWLSERYDPAKYCVLGYIAAGHLPIPPEPAFPEQQAAALEWMSRGRGKAKPNFEPAFQDGF